MKLSNVFFLILFLSVFSMAQDESDGLSNIQNYTPSKLLEKGKWDIKWFNNLYSETTAADENGDVSDIQRRNFFNSSVEVFTGITDSKVINVGLIIEARSNTINGEPLFSPLGFGNDNNSRSGIGHIAPSIKVAPFKKLSNLSFQSSFFIPVFDEETDENGIFLAQKSFIWQNRFFYDHTFAGGDWQVFTELGTRLFLGDSEESFANNSLELAPSVFLSYFPSSKFTVLTFVQHARLIDLGNDFSQNFTAIGAGAKYQLTPAVNLEFLASDFIFGESTGLGSTLNLGVRIIL